MDIIIILIAIGLAMDSFSVSITRGFASTKTKLSIEALKTGFFFGLFQAVMPLIGWFAGLSVIDFISGFDHWLAFGLLCLIGLRMIYESISKESKQVGQIKPRQSALESLIDWNRERLISKVICPS